MTTDFQYDVFLCHSSEDKDSVRRLAAKLESDGFRVWLDEAMIPYGGIIPVEIERGIKDSHLLFYLVSAASQKSSSVIFERSFAQFRDITSQARRFVPILIDDCKVDESLSMFRYLDWKTQSEEGYLEIVQVIREAISSVQDSTSTANRSLFSKEFDEQVSARIRGGNPLHGEVWLRGAKNSVPKQMIASLLTADTCCLSNVPNIRDVAIVSEMIRSIGGEVESRSNGHLEISSARIETEKFESLAQFDELSRMPIHFLAVLLHRFGRAVIPRLGGCELNGSAGRPVNYHLDALQAMGATVHQLPDKTIRGSAPNGLRCASITLEGPSVGATEQILLAAAPLDGMTQIHNAAVEPEVLDLVDAIRMMGASVSIDNVRTITIHGTSKLQAFNIEATTDRSEIGSWAAAAAATRGSIAVRNANVNGLTDLIGAFQQMGGTVETLGDGLRFDASSGDLEAINIETGPFPKFKTDWQPVFAVALTQASGKSLIHETVFSDRFGYALTLKNMGADIEVLTRCPSNSICKYADQSKSHTAVIRGRTTLSPMDISLNELRGGFASVVAALVADGESSIRNMQWLGKGYEDIEDKLKALGADIEIDEGPQQSR